MVCACRRWISHGPMCTPSAVGKPRFFVSSRRNDIFSSSEVAGVADAAAPLPADVMHVPFSGLPPAPTTVSGISPLGAGGACGCCGFGSRMIGLNATSGDPVGEILLAQEVEQRRVAVDRGLVEVAADGDAALVRHRAHVGDDLVERPLPAAQRPHPVVRVAIAVERDLDRRSGRTASADRPPRA